MSYQTTLFDIDVDSASTPDLYTGARFSPCRTWRYLLWRIWDRSIPQCIFIGLNPSTADETQDDPTIRRCINFSKDWGYGGYLMLNSFGFRATDPRVMKACPAPNGAHNDQTIQDYCQWVFSANGRIVAAWGVHCPLEREVEICNLIQRPIYCLGTTKAGRPKHPLYLRKETKPELFWQPRNEWELPNDVAK